MILRWQNKHGCLSRFADRLDLYSSCFCSPCFLPDAACATDDATLTAELPTLRIPVQRLTTTTEEAAVAHVTHTSRARGGEHTVLCNVGGGGGGVDGGSGSTSCSGCGAASKNKHHPETHTHSKYSCMHTHPSIMLRSTCVIDHCCEAASAAASGARPPPPLKIQTRRSGPSNWRLSVG